MLNFEYMLGFLFGVLCALILIALIIKLSRKGHPGKCIVDERQRLVRGTGFKYAFFTLMIYDVILAFLMEFCLAPFITAPAAALLGICLSIAVFAVYCIWNDGYYTLNENPKVITTSFLLIALLNLINFGRYVHEGEVVVNHVIEVPIVTLAAALLLLLVAFTTILKSVRRKGEDEE